MSLPLAPGIQRHGKTQGGGGAAAETDTEGDLVPGFSRGSRPWPAAHLGAPEGVRIQERQRRHIAVDGRGMELPLVAQMDKKVADLGLAHLGR